MSALLLGGLLLAAAGLASDSPPPAAHWTDSCRFAERGVTLAFDSRSGDPLEDDMAVTATRDDGVALVLPLGRSLYEPRTLLANVANLCQRAAAVQVGADRVLLLLSANGRPTWDVLDLVLIDTAAMRALDVQTNVGAIKTVDRVIVLRRLGASRLAVRLIRGQLRDAGCDCESASIEDWKWLDVTEDRIRTGWQSPADDSVR